MGQALGFSGVGKVGAFARTAGGLKGLGYMLGNCPKFEVGATANAVERNSSMEPTRSPLRRMTQATALAVTLATDEFNKKNVALVTQGRVDEVAADAVTTITKTCPTGAVVGSVLATDDMNVTDLVVKDSTGSPKTLTLDVNYTVDLFSGQVELIELSTGGPFVQPFKLEHKRGAVSVVAGLAVGSQELWLSAALTNVDDLSRGHVDVYRVRLDPASVIAYINADYNDFELKGTALVDTSKTAAAVGGQIYRWGLPSTHA